MVSPGGAGITGRRELFRRTIGSWLEQLIERTEERVSPERYLRPPGALPEVAFLTACTRCGECLQVCPPFAIRKAPPDAGLAAGTPYIDPELVACIACPDMPCARACPTGALSLPVAGWSGYRLAAVELVPERCVTFAGTSCRACADACPVGEPALAMDEDGHPVLKAEGCVGCGCCVRACITAPSSFTWSVAGRREARGDQSPVTRRA
jgi:MauM/NapG family ferredoxin protein